MFIYSLTVLKLSHFICVIWRRHIDEEDLLCFMNTEEVDNVLLLFEGAVHTGKIKKLSFCNWVVSSLFVAMMSVLCLFFCAYPRNLLFQFDAY